MGGSVDTSFSCTPQIVIEGVAVGAARGPNLLPPEVWQIVGQPGLGNSSIMGTSAVLLKDVRAPHSHTIYPGLDHISHNFNIRFSINSEAPLEEVGGIMSPSLDTTPRTITDAGNFDDITTGTFLGSSHSHLSFCRFTFWSMMKFFSSEKSITICGVQLKEVSTGPPTILWSP